MVEATTEDGVDQVKQPCTVKLTGQTMVSIELWPIRYARLVTEQEAADAEQEAADKAAQGAQAKTERESREKSEQEAQEKAARGRTPALDRPDNGADVDEARQWR
jgi:ATPase subunit of ABC transporter with duplicated ATPase domains